MTNMGMVSNQKLVAYITSKRRESIIKEALKYIDYDLQHDTIGENESTPIKPILNTLSMMTLDIIIIDLMAISDEDELINSLRNYKAVKEETRIIFLLSAIHKKGSALPSNIVSLNYYDLIAYDEPTNEEQNLKQLLQKKNSYANAMKWQKFNEEPAANAVDGQIRPSNHPKTIYKHVYNSRIMIANFTKRAGSSFLTLNLARMIDQSGIDVNVVEPPVSKPYIYHALNFDEKLRINSRDDNYRSSFVSYPHEIIESKPNTIIDINALNNKDGNITYFIASPHETSINEYWSEQNMIDLLNLATRATVTIVDAGEHFLDERYKSMLPHMDRIYVLLEPLAPDCLLEIEKLDKIREMKEKGYNIEFVYSKVADMSSLKDFERFTGDKERGFFKNLTKTSLKIPFLKPKYVHKALNQGDYAINNTEISFDLHNALYGIAQQFIPKQLFKKVGKKVDYIEEGTNVVKTIIGKAKQIYDEF